MRISFYMSFAVAIVGCAAISGCTESSESDQGRDVAATEPGAKPVKTRCGARDTVRNALKQSGLRCGFDANKSSMIAMGTHGFEYEIGKFGESGFQYKRFRAYEAAILEALAQIAECVQSTSSAKGKASREKKISAENPEGNSSEFSIGASIKVCGYKVLYSAESYDPGNGYECSVAIVWSKSVGQRAQDALQGRLNQENAQDADTLEEYLESKSFESYVGPDCFVDGDGRTWMLGFACVDAAQENADVVAIERAAYAAEYALGGELESVTLMETKDVGPEYKGREFLRVQNHSLRFEFDEVCDGTSQCLKKVISLKTHFKIDSKDRSIVWKTMKIEHPISGRHVLLKICAYPTDARFR